MDKAEAILAVELNAICESGTIKYYAYGNERIKELGKPPREFIIHAKQIDEMARDICRVGGSCDECERRGRCRALKYAQRAYGAGYRRRTNGEWLAAIYFSEGSLLRCSACGRYDVRTTDFCPYCGAHMRGGKNE